MFSSALPSALYAIARTSREATSLWLSARASGSTFAQSPPTDWSSFSYSLASSSVSGIAVGSVITTISMKVRLLPEQAVALSIVTD